MFTGIIETMGEVTDIQKEGTNLNICILSDISKELSIDQSVAHNGVCLTVTSIENDSHRVTAIEETLQKTNLGSLKTGQKVNLERSMQMNGRMDGHIVQGHVDQTAICIKREDRSGSWHFWFEYDENSGNITVEKGSVCVNGVSLTVVESSNNLFSVAIIPYTYSHTSFQELKKDDLVNIEFDILGKYIRKYLNSEVLKQMLTWTHN